MTSPDANELNESLVGTASISESEISKDAILAHRQIITINSNNVSTQHPVQTRDEYHAMPVNNSSTLPLTLTPPPFIRRRSSFIELLGSTVKIEAGGINGTIFTMVISTVGAGCLSLPYAVREVGLLFGIGLLIFGAILAYFTLDLLLIASEYLPIHCRSEKPNRNISYETLSQYSWGKRLSTFIKIFMCIQYFAGLVAYIVAYSGLIDLVWSLYNSQSVYIYIAIGVTSIIVLPLSLLRNVTSLRFTSLMGFSCSVYLALVIMVEYFMLCGNGSVRDDVDHGTTCFWKINDGFYFSDQELFPLNTFQNFYQGFLTAFPLNIFAFTGHPFLLPLYVELKQPTIGRMRNVFQRGIIICFCIYFCVGVFGYLLFLDETCGNVLTNDFKKGVLVIIAALGIAVSCILTQPIYAYNFRRMVGRLLWGQGSADLPTNRHVIITVVVIAVSIPLGAFVKSVASVFGILGSTIYPMLGYIFPALFFVKIVPKEKYKIRKILAVVQAVFITIVSVCSLMYKILYQPGDSSCYNKQTIK